MTHRIRRGTLLTAMYTAIPALWTNAKAEPSWWRKYNATRTLCHNVYPYQRIADQRRRTFTASGFDSISDSHA